MTSDPASRMLSLLSLLQTPREWPGSELADRLGVSGRTVRRDIDRLRELGYPVEATRGGEGGYRLVAGAAMPPLLLDDEEAVAIAVGLRSAAGQAIEGIDEAAVRALGKLEQVLPARLRYRVGTLGAATVPMPVYGPVVATEVLTAIAAGIANHERLRFRYRTAADDEAGRLVEPHRLVPVGRRWYFVAYDNDRGDWRTFRVDRITDVRPTGVRVPARELPGADAAAYVTRSLYGLAPTYRAVVTLHAPAEAVAPRVTDAGGKLTPIDDHSCRVETGSDTLDWLAFQLMSLDCEFEIHEPAELVSRVHTLGIRLTRAATTHTS